MNFDIVIPIGPSQTSIAYKTISSVNKLLKPSRIYIVSSEVNYKKINTQAFKNVHFLNEDEIVQGLSLSAIKDYFLTRISRGERASWYFQQFVKIGISNLDFISENYLIWDADCVLLKRLEFYNDGKILVTKTSEYHPPYFEVIENLFGIRKQVDFSFISEHFLFNKNLVKEMINEINGTNSEPWYIKILNTIRDENLLGSGFSEYETYGSFVKFKYPELFKERDLKVFREGGLYCGMNPSRLDLWILSFVYTYVSFESWMQKRHKRKELIRMVREEYKKLEK